MSEVSKNIYAFRRSDNDQIIWVDWSTMIDQQNGFITIDGVEARRCTHLEKSTCRKLKIDPNNITSPPAISDSLGFPEQCLAGRQRQLQELGCRGIEFKRDPKCPEFFQVHGSSRSALDSYTKKRGFVNRTGSLGGGVILSQDDINRAAEIVTRTA